MISEVSKPRMHMWQKRFCEGPQDAKDDEYYGCLLMSKTSENVQTIQEIV